MQLWASVRRNGTGMIWSECTEVTDYICPVADSDLVETMECEDSDEDCEPVNRRFREKCKLYRDCSDADETSFVCEQKQCVSRREVRNCKRDGQCVDLNSQYLCTNGLCQNVSRVMECDYQYTADTYDCTDKRNCITITGLFDCKEGVCLQVLWPWNCRRRCPTLPLDDANLVIVSGDRTITANCSYATQPMTGERVWEGKKHHGILLVSCTDVTMQESDSLWGLDCVNGTFLPLQSRPDWSRTRRILSDNDERRAHFIPETTELDIFQRAKVQNIK